MDCKHCSYLSLIRSKLVTCVNKYLSGTDLCWTLVGLHAYGFSNFEKQAEEAGRPSEATQKPLLSLPSDGSLSTTGKLELRLLRLPEYDFLTSLLLLQLKMPLAFLMTLLPAPAKFPPCPLHPLRAVATGDVAVQRPSMGNLFSVPPP